MTHTRDEQQIRDLIHAWLQASRDGNIELLMGLVTEDVVFLTAGNPPMSRAEFEARFRAMRGKVAIDGTPQIREITIQGDLALCWLFLEITITPIGGETMHRSGNILSAYRRGADGRWRIWRDANLLTA